MGRREGLPLRRRKAVGFGLFAMMSRLLENFQLRLRAQTCAAVRRAMLDIWDGPPRGFAVPGRLDNWRTYTMQPVAGLRLGGDLRLKTSSLCDRSIQHGDLGRIDAHVGAAAKFRNNRRSIWQHRIDRAYVDVPATQLQ